MKWLKIYRREYGVQYSEAMLLSIVPSASTHHFIIPDNKATAFYAERGEWRKLERSLYKKHACDLQTAKKFEISLITCGKEYVAFCKRVSKNKLSEKSNKKLLQIYIRYQKILLEYTRFVAQVFIINNYLSQKASFLDIKQQVLSKLLTPYKKSSVLQFENNAKEAAYEDYMWLSCQDLHNKALSKSQFEEMKREFAKTKQVNTQKSTEDLKIKKKYRDFFEIAQRFAYLKDVRDELRRKGIFYILPFFAEIGRRMNIGAGDVSYLQSDEISAFLKTGRRISKHVLHDRRGGFGMYVGKKNAVVFVERRDCQKLLGNLKLSVEGGDIKVVAGMVASRGKAEGRVVVVLGIADLIRVTRGCILVAHTTHPDYTIAMRKAAAIVTDEGGITSHAAIVAREFGIPCIVGTGSATKILKDGDFVKVDAFKGEVNTPKTKS